MADVRSLVELGMPGPLAKEVMAQTQSGVANVRRMVELTMVPALAKELAAQITSRTASVRRLVELGMVPPLAKVVSSLAQGGVLPTGLSFIPLPDPILYSNPGKGIVGTGLIVLGDDLSNLTMIVADGEGKPTDAVNTDPRLWSIWVLRFNAYSRQLTVVSHFPGSDIVAGLFEDGSSPNWNSGATPIVSTQYGCQGLGYVDATARVKINLVNPVSGSVTWVVEIDPATGSRTAVIRYPTTRFNHFEPVNDGGALNPARSFTIGATTFNLRNTSTGAQIGTGKSHGLASIDMLDFDEAKGHLHISHGARSITTFPANTTDPSLGGAALGTHVLDLAVNDIEGIRSRPETLYALCDFAYHGSGPVNSLMVQTPNPILPLYP